MSTVRQQAIQAIAGARHNLNRIDFKKTHMKDLFGANVFNEEVQRQMLPKPIFRALQKTTKQGATLDPAIADSIATATVAPELAGAEGFVRACRARGIRCNAGHSYATFEQVEAAVGWGVRHVDHLFCAMSDRARLRQEQTYPMRGGLLEAALYFDDGGSGHGVQ